MEIKNLIETNEEEYCLSPEEKEYWRLIRTFLVLINKAERHWANVKIRKISKGKNLNK